MSKPSIHGVRRTLTASNILSALADDLAHIKSEDRLTYADIGRVLGKSEDQAAKYCDGSAEMGVVSFAFAKREWNGRFTGTLDQMISDSLPQTCDRSKAAAIARANYELNVALEDDNAASPAEIRAMRKTLEGAADAIRELLQRLAVRAA